MKTIAFCAILFLALIVGYCDLRDPVMSKCLEKNSLDTCHHNLNR